MKGKTAKVLLVAGVLAVLVLGGGYLGYRKYVALRQSRLVQQAHHYLDKADPKNAMLCLQRALRFNANDLEATRLMADLMDVAHAPNAVKWRRRVVELDPHSLKDRLALVDTAMDANDFATATNALAQVAPADQSTVRYQLAAGSVAATFYRLPEAEQHFQEALRLEPGNLQAQLSLARVRLHDADQSVATTARNTLAGMSHNPTNSAVRCQALRELIGDALGRHQLANALAVSTTLVRETNSLFSDRLVYVQLLQETGATNFAATLQALQQEAAGTARSPHDVFLLAQWETGRISPAAAMQWLQTLPGTTLTNQPLAVLVAGNYAALRQWQALETFLKPLAWGERECLRHAYLTRALREQGSDAGARVEWELAVGSTHLVKQRLLWLQDLMTRWQWRPELQEVLQHIVDLDPAAKPEVLELITLLIESGDTRGLLVLCNQLSKRDPTDLNDRNTMIMAALLLNAVEYKPYELAQKLYQQAPTNAAFASTYAFALHLQNQDAAALKVFQQLPPLALEQPAIAGYYGLVLQGLGEKQRALPYLNLASKAKLLPEEKKLFDRAKSGQ